MTSLEEELAQILRVIRHAKPDVGPGPPDGVLAGMVDLVRADSVSYLEMDSTRLTTLVAREAGDACTPDPGLDERLFWSHYWDCEPCCYPDRTGDLASITLMSDFYSTRQLHSTGMYADYFRPANIEHEIMVCLPSTPTISRRLVFFRGPGRDFSERDRLVLMLLRPHLAELNKRDQLPQAGPSNLTPRQRELLDLVAAGQSNDAIARRLMLSPHTVRKHLENIFARLGVTNRTAAAAALLETDQSLEGIEPRR